MSGLSLLQVRQFVIDPVEAALPSRVKPCPNLLLGTMLVESGGIYIKQLGGGPAIGLMEMEPATHNDCYFNFLRYTNNADLMSVVKSTLGVGPFAGVGAMAGNLYYAFIMARIKYFRVEAALPDDNDAAALSAYHKQYYNTAGGATNIDQSVLLFQQAIDAVQAPS